MKEMVQLTAPELSTPPGAGGAVDGFHPAVAEWFRRRFPDGPTEAQALGWPHIASGADTLIAAPTGSGKTLAAFLVAIDRLYREHDRGVDVSTGTRVVYVSPLKALAVDIGENLERPLAEIADIAAELGLDSPEIRVAVRTGDTTSSQRSAMVRRPPSFVVTTPESLYLLVTSARGREALRTTETVIVDEIHAVARDKRGSHLALTLERLEALCDRRPARIGLSATQRPIERVGRLLVGERPLPEIVDVGHQRALDVTLELPEGELEAVASAEQMSDVINHIAEHVTHHQTTLVFVNTRRMAERLAHQLGERLGDDVVAAHHGSLSKERRWRVETRLRAGALKALVATASLELGIDIGPVELVCQIGSPRSIATFLQRVGRSNHTRTGTPKGRLYPLTRDELVECTALLMAVRAGRLDAIEFPHQPLDIAAQQIIAEVAAEEWRTDDLYELVRRAAPYAELSRAEFDEVVELVSGGIETGRGRRGAYVHHDAVNGELRGRKGARIAAATSGGAIPETGDYRVVAEPDDTFVGTVNEDWAVESMAGDIFLLGTHSWQIRRIEPGVVRVRDAAGALPTIPFWLGEAPARTVELSTEVSELRRHVDEYLVAGRPDDARQWLIDAAGIPREAAVMIVDYLAAGRAALGAMPTQHQLVLERFFDDTGGMQLVVHSPYGGRINRALGLALRKKFCRTFDFELQAAATDDAIVLSLGLTHSFPLEEVPRYVRSGTVEDTLEHAILDSPMFQARWRWNLNRALMVLRFRNGRRNPPPIQRMESDDLLAAVFPQAAACQDNQTGPIEIPDHVLVRETVGDTLHEALDVDGLRVLLEGIEGGDVTVHCVDTTEASALSHEIINARPYAFLDDEEFQNRRTNAVTLRRGLTVDLTAIGSLDPDAIEQVHSEIAPEPATADDLHDLLSSLVLVRPSADWQPLFDELAARGRAGVLDHDGVGLWCTTEARADAASALTGDDVAASRVIRGHLEISGITTAEDLAATTTLAPGARRVRAGGVAARGLRHAGHVPARCGGHRVGRPPPPRADALLLAAVTARACRARHRAGLHAVPPALAACHARFPAQRRGRAGLGHRAAAGLRGGGGHVGAGPSRAPAPSLRARVARPAVPRRRRCLAAPHAGSSRSRRSRRRAVEGHTDRGRVPRRSRLAARRRPPGHRAGRALGGRDGGDRAGPAGQRRVLRHRPRRHHAPPPRRRRTGPLGRRRARARHVRRLRRYPGAHQRCPERVGRSAHVAAAARRPRERVAWTVVRRARRQRGRGSRRARRGGRRAAHQPLGCRVPRPRRPRLAAHAVARHPVGPPSPGGSRSRTRRAFRQRFQRRAVRAPARSRRADTGPEDGPVR